MDISTPDTEPADTTRSAFSDGLTLVRVFLAALVFIIIILGWPSLDAAVLVTVLFACGALTDLLDDLIGGPAVSRQRMFGWFDDIADAVLIGAALLGLLWVTFSDGMLSWTFAIPVILYVGRDIALGLAKGRDFNSAGRPLSRLGDIKSALAMMGVTLLLASPWLQSWIDRTLAGDDPDKLAMIYNASTPHVWLAGLVLLWIATLISLYLFFRYIRARPILDMDTPL
ncbi:CDP-alcohol phosphatidyltransferase family protein [Robiginitomaculum antarcticum]|uniref:CDP-alcohol phosphatidyltransferase family protein n=1 Tax=Robiginitomaculum antarcticum TaxID=437507 RepID=UPI000381A141|nr:CDP-alcohol phosphatidyltransferase family protein [Robiginitomaculum antarcticum]